MANLPSREVCLLKGWKFQVDWNENNLPCFVRCKTGIEADAWANKLEKQKLNPVVTDLLATLQLH